MSLMQGGFQNFPTTTLLKTSHDLGWSTLFADLRSFGPGNGPVPAAPHTKISIILRGPDEGVAALKVAGTWQTARPTTGKVWLWPIEAKVDEYENRIASPMELLHLFVPNVAFARLTDDYNLPPMPERSIRHSCGVQDDVIHQIGLAVMSEMMSPTAAGRMFVETASLLLAARLAHVHSETALNWPPIRSHAPLDQRRLNRVLAYIEEHLADEITVENLASVACLSVFHFTRVFAATVGVPPHRYVSQRRLEIAREMIVTGRGSLCEIARATQFSSQSSFARAFRRATGMTPAEFRRRSH